MAYGLHNPYSYFLIFKDIITAQGLACILLSARGSESAITEWRKVLVALRRGRKSFQGKLGGTGALISSFSTYQTGNLFQHLGVNFISEGIILL